MAGLRTINAVWKQEGDVFACSEATPFAPGQLGDVAVVQSTTGVNAGQSPKLVQYVKRRATDALALTAGQAVYWVDNTSYTITDTQSAAIGGTTTPMVAGFVQSSNPQPGSYGFIQVGGPGLALVSNSTTASTTAQGRVLYVNTNATFGHVVAANGTDITTLLTYANRPTLGVLVVGNNATTTNLTVQALIDVTRLGW